jgi:hypothetical protein
MIDYSINNYLNFNLSYKLTIDHILVDYIDKQFNQHKLNKCFYCIVNICMRLTQLEWINSKLK